MKRIGPKILPYWPALLIVMIKLVDVAQTRLGTEQVGNGCDGIPDGQEEHDFLVY